MLILFWAIINIGIFLVFIILCFKATAFIREKLGLAASIVFVFGLLSFTGSSLGDDHGKGTKSNLGKTWEFNLQETPEKKSTSHVEVVLGETMISEYLLGIHYEKSNGLPIPASSYSLMTGLYSGTYWKPTSVKVFPSADNSTLGYNVNGVVEWKLMGATIYTQRQEYHGSVAAK